jgi:hypothetical protein
VGENSCESILTAPRAVTGRDEKALCAAAILWIGMAGVVQMELIDMAGVPGWYFS